jgi:hypothetical protein
MVCVALRTRKMMSGEMSSTRVSTEMEMDCCFSAAVRSDSTMSLVGQSKRSVNSALICR